MTLRRHPYLPQRPREPDAKEAPAPAMVTVPLPQRPVPQAIPVGPVGRIEDMRLAELETRIAALEALVKALAKAMAKDPGPTVARPAARRRR